jgi:hypothetical protein
MNKENQDSQGGLIRHDQPFLFETLEEKIEEVNVSDIQHFTTIPDYVTLADSKYPFVVKTPSSMNCIDGWHLVEEAVAQGKSTVTCKVEFIAEHSDEELAIRKVALRIKPKGGTGSYAEIVRNTQCLEKILLASDKDLRVFHHGGDRKGEGFINNRQENVREILSFRLGKSVSTINQFLNHARFLDDETLNFFASQKVEKDFFEEAQKTKRVEIIRMKGERKSDADITVQISNDVGKWYQEYLQSGKIQPIMATQETDAKVENNHPEIQTPQEPEPRLTVPKVFNPCYGNASGAGDEEDSLEKVKREFKLSAQKLLEAFDLSDLDEFERRITENLKHLCRIPQRLSPLRSREIRTDSYKEVALQ